MMPQKNLAEIESKIRSILCESDTNRRRQQYLASSDEIERKFVFLKSQLAAHTDHRLSRLENLHATFTRFGDSLVHDQPLGSDEVEDTDDQSGSGVFTFKAYDNPCWDSGDVEDRSAVTHQPVGVEEGFARPENEKATRGGDYCRGLLVGILSGAVATVAPVVAIVVPFALRCRFDDAVTGVREIRSARCIYMNTSLIRASYSFARTRIETSVTVVNNNELSKTWLDCTPTRARAARTEASGGGGKPAGRIRDPVG